MSQGSTRECKYIQTGVCVSERERERESECVHRVCVFVCPTEVDDDPRKHNRGAMREATLGSLEQALGLVSRVSNLIDICAPLPHPSCVHVCMCQCVHVCMCVCVNVCMCVQAQFILCALVYKSAVMWRWRWNVSKLCVLFLLTSC